MRPCGRWRPQGRCAWSALIDILSALGEPESTGDGGLGVVRIAQIVCREKSQVSRALRTLDEAGLVERDPVTREYRVGWRVFALAARGADQRLLALAPAVLSASWRGSARRRTSACSTATRS